MVYSEITVLLGRPVFLFKLWTYQFCITPSIILMFLAQFTQIIFDPQTDFLHYDLICYLGMRFECLLDYLLIIWFSLVFLVNYLVEY